MVELTKTRPMERSWYEELKWLRGKGYGAAFNALDALAVPELSCDDCGRGEMDYFGFTIAGIVNRSYAVCPKCRYWKEF